MKAGAAVLLSSALLAGCAGMTTEKFGDIVVQVLAARLAAGPGYNYQQGLEQGQAYLRDAEQRRLNEELRWRMSQPTYETIRCKQNGSYINCTAQQW